MSNTPTLETERLILRKFTENDLEALYQIYRDPDVNRFLPWFPLQSMDEARKFFEDRYASLYAEPQAYAYAICLKRGNRPIGYVKVDMAERFRLWPARGILASGNRHRGRKGRHRTSKAGRAALYHGHARCQQSPKRRRDAANRDEVPVFL